MNHCKSALWGHLVSGAFCAGQALQYFLSGEQITNSNMRNSLVVLQYFFGIWVIRYGWKKFR